MMYTEIFLGKEILEENELGEKEKNIVFDDKSIFCSEKSVRSSEFYQAMQTGMKIEKVVKVNKYEYFDYMKSAIRKFAQVRHSISNELIIYTVAREYELNDDDIELSLIRGVENDNA